MSTLIESTAQASVDAVMGQIVGELGASLGVLLTDLGLRCGLWATLRGAGALSRDRPGRPRRRPGGSGPRVGPRSGRRRIPGLRARHGSLRPARTRRDRLAGRARRCDGRRLHRDVAVDAGRVRRSGRRLPCRRQFRLASARLPPLARRRSVDPRPAAGRGDLCGRRGDAGDRGRSRRRRPGARRRLRLRVSNDCDRGPFPVRDGGRVGLPPSSIEEARRIAEAAGVAGRVAFTVGAATDLPGSNYSLISYFDSLHDFGEPIRRVARGAGCARARRRGARRRCRRRRAGRRQSQSDGPHVLRVSTLICTPNALSQQPPGSAGAARDVRGRRAAHRGRPRSRVHARDEIDRAGHDEPPARPSPIAAVP